MTALGSIQTLEELEQLASQNRAIGTLLRIIKVTCPTTFSNAVIEAISEWIDDATRQAHLYRGLKEDQITLFLITHLKASGFDATHDTANGGHCDVVVKHSKGYIWLAEAKIHDGPRYIFEDSDFRSMISRLWLHCKNAEAIEYLGEHFLRPNFFWHQSDDYTLTSWGYSWTYPNLKPTKKSIAVLPEIFNASRNDLIGFWGVCTDYPIEFDPSQSQ